MQGGFRAEYEWFRPRKHNPNYFQWVLGSVPNWSNSHQNLCVKQWASHWRAPKRWVFSKGAEVTLLTGWKSEYDWLKETLETGRGLSLKTGYCRKEGYWLILKRAFLGMSKEGMDKEERVVQDCTKWQIQSRPIVHMMEVSLPNKINSSIHSDKS